MGSSTRLARQVAQEVPVGRGELFAGTARSQAKSTDELALVGQGHDQAHTASGDDVPVLSRRTEVYEVHKIRCAAQSFHGASILDGHAGWNAAVGRPETQRITIGKPDRRLRQPKCPRDVLYDGG